MRDLFSTGRDCTNFKSFLPNAKTLRFSLFLCQFEQRNVFWGFVSNNAYLCKTVLNKHQGKIFFGVLQRNCAKEGATLVSKIKVYNDISLIEGIFCELMSII